MYTIEMFEQWLADQARMAALQVEYGKREGEITFDEVNERGFWNTCCRCVPDGSWLSMQGPAVYERNLLVRLYLLGLVSSREGMGCFLPAWLGRHHECYSARELLRRVRERLETTKEYAQERPDPA